MKCRHRLLSCAQSIIVPDVSFATSHRYGLAEHRRRQQHQHKLCTSLPCLIDEDKAGIAKGVNMNSTTYHPLSANASFNTRACRAVSTASTPSSRTASRPSAEEIHYLICHALRAKTMPVNRPRSVDSETRKNWQHAVDLFIGAVHLECVPLPETYDAILHAILHEGSVHDCAKFILKLATSFHSMCALFSRACELVYISDTTIGAVSHAPSENMHSQLVYLIQAVCKHRLSVHPSHLILAWSILLRKSRPLETLSLLSALNCETPETGSRGEMDGGDAHDRHKNHQSIECDELMARYFAKSKDDAGISFTLHESHVLCVLFLLTQTLRSLLKREGDCTTDTFIVDNENSNDVNYTTKDSNSNDDNGTSQNVQSTVHDNTAFSRIDNDSRYTRSKTTCVTAHHRRVAADCRSSCLCYCCCYARSRVQTPSRVPNPAFDGRENSYDVHTADLWLLQRCKPHLNNIADVVEASLRVASTTMDPNLARVCLQETTYIVLMLHRFATDQVDEISARRWVSIMHTLRHVDFASLQGRDGTSRAAEEDEERGGGAMDTCARHETDALQLHKQLCGAALVVTQMKIIRLSLTRGWNVSSQLLHDYIGAITHHLTHTIVCHHYRALLAISYLPLLCRMLLYARSRTAVGQTPRCSAHDLALGRQCVLAYVSLGDYRGALVCAEKLSNTALFPITVPREAYRHTKMTVPNRGEQSDDRTEKGDSILDVTHALDLICSAQMNGSKSILTRHNTNTSDGDILHSSITKKHTCVPSPRSFIAVAHGATNPSMFTLHRLLHELHTMSPPQRKWLDRALLTRDQLHYSEDRLVRNGDKACDGHRVGGHTVEGSSWASVLHRIAACMQHVCRWAVWLETLQYWRCICQACHRAGVCTTATDVSGATTAVTAPQVRQSLRDAVLAFVRAMQQGDVALSDMVYAVRVMAVELRLPVSAPVYHILLERISRVTREPFVHGGDCPAGEFQSGDQSRSRSRTPRLSAGDYSSSLTVPHPNPHDDKDRRTRHGGRNWRDRDETTGGRCPVCCLGRGTYLSATERYACARELRHIHASMARERLTRLGQIVDPESADAERGSGLWRGAARCVHVAHMTGGKGDSAADSLLCGDAPLGCGGDVRYDRFDLTYAEMNALSRLTPMALFASTRRLEAIGRGELYSPLRRFCTVELSLLIRWHLSTIQAWYKLRPSFVDVNLVTYFAANTPVHTILSDVLMHHKRGTLHYARAYQHRVHSSAPPLLCRDKEPTNDQAGVHSDIYRATPNNSSCSNNNSTTTNNSNICNNRGSNSHSNESSDAMQSMSNSHIGGRKCRTSMYCFDESADLRRESTKPSSLDCGDTEEATVSLLRNVMTDLLWDCASHATIRSIVKACLMHVQALVHMRWSNVVECELRQATLARRGRPPPFLYTAPALAKKDIATYWSLFHRVLIPDMHMHAIELCCVAQYSPELERIRECHAARVCASPHSTYTQDDINERAVRMRTSTNCTARSVTHATVHASSCVTDDNTHTNNTNGDIDKPHSMCCGHDSMRAHCVRSTTSSRSQQHANLSRYCVGAQDALCRDCEVWSLASRIHCTHFSHSITHTSRAVSDPPPSSSPTTLPPSLFRQSHSTEAIYIILCRAHKQLGQLWMQLRADQPGMGSCMDWMAPIIQGQKSYMKCQSIHRYDSSSSSASRGLHCCALHDTLASDTPLSFLPDKHDDTPVRHTHYLRAALLQSTMRLCVACEPSLPSAADATIARDTFQTVPVEMLRCVLRGCALDAMESRTSLGKETWLGRATLSLGQALRHTRSEVASSTLADPAMPDADCTNAQASHSDSSSLTACGDQCMSAQEYVTGSLPAARAVMAKAVHMPVRGSTQQWKQAQQLVIADWSSRVVSPCGACRRSPVRQDDACACVNRVKSIALRTLLRVLLSYAQAQTPVPSRATSMLLDMVKTALQSGSAVHIVGDGASHTRFTNFAYNHAGQVEPNTDLCEHDRSDVDDDDDSFYTHGCASSQDMLFAWIALTLCNAWDYMSIIHVTAIRRLVHPRRDNVQRLQSLLHDVKSQQS